MSTASVVRGLSVQTTRAHTRAFAWYVGFALVTVTLGNFVEKPFVMGCNMFSYTYLSM